MRGIRELWESFSRAHNADQNASNRKVAVKAFTDKVISLIESKKLAWTDISIRALYEGLVSSQDLQEHINSSAFPYAMTQIINKRVMDSYNEAITLQSVLNLVTVVQANQKESTIDGFTPLSDLYEVPEGHEYREVKFGEKQVKVKAKKYGGVLSITEETIRFDQTGNILNRAAQLGRRGAAFQAKIILKALVDADANVYNGAELFPTDNSNGNYQAGAGTALGTEGWELADTTLGEMTDEDGEPINVLGVRPVLMVPPRLKAMALKLKNGDYSGIGTANLDPNIAKDQFDVVVNPFFPNVKTTKAWEYGSFKDEFAWAEVWPLQTFSRAGQGTEEGFYRDVIQVFKVRFMGGAGAVDKRFVVKMAGE